MQCVCHKWLLAFPFVLSQIIVDGLADNVGMSKDCNENDGLMISRNNAAPTPSQPRQFGCPEQQFNKKHSWLHTVLQQRSSGGQVKCTVPPSPLLWKNQDDFFETFDDEVKALVRDVDQLVQRRASRAVDVLLTQVPDCPVPARDRSPAVRFQCRLNKQTKRHWEPYPWFFQPNFFDQDQLDPNT